MAKQGPLSGQQVANKYRLGGLLGSGGMGAVYKAHDIRLNRPVAMKVMSPADPLSAAELQHFTQLFQAEALRLASLKHRGIPHIYDHLEEAAHWFLAMEFIEGETLKDYLERRGGRLPVDEVLRIGFQLADVLNYLHAPLPNKPTIIFRDLKPTNVMITPDGQVFLIDFGIARLFTPGKSRDTFVFLSQGYAAPEQYGTAQTTVRSDIYSLGATLHHLLSGTHPATSPFLFAPLSIQQLPQLATLIAHVVAIDAAYRPASMAEVKVALQRMIDQTAVAGLSISAVSPPTTPVPPPVFPTVQPAQPAMGTAPLAGSSIGSPFPPTASSKPSAIGAPPRGTTLVIYKPSKEPVPGESSDRQQRNLKESFALAWSPDGQRIASGSTREYIYSSYGETQHGTAGRVEVWDGITGKTLEVYGTQGFPFESISEIVWSPDGRYIVVLGQKALIWAWKAKKGIKGKIKEGIFRHREREVVVSGGALVGTFGYSYSPDSRISHPQVLLWSPDSSKVAALGAGTSDSTGLEVLALREREAIVQESVSARDCNGDAVVWSPDSTRIAWGTGNEIPVWDVRSPEQKGHHLLTYREHRSPVAAVSWSPDGRQITSRSVDGSGLLWDAESGQTLGTFTGPAEKIKDWPSLGRATFRPAISPDGTFKAIPTDDGIELQMVTDGTTVFVYREHCSDKTSQYWSPEVKALAWSPDGARIAFARFDGTIYIWWAF